MSNPAPVTEQPQKRMEMAELYIGCLAPDREQQRRHFDLLALGELAASIEVNGVIEPIIVRPFRDGETDIESHIATHRIIAGERRWRAATQAGLDSMPCVIRHGLSDDEIIVIQAIGNLQREDLTLDEQATACARLSNSVGLDAAAEQLGKSKGWVSLRAGIIEMPIEIRELVQCGAVRDVQIINSLSQLWSYDPARAQQIIGQFIDPPKHAGGRVPSRDEVATAVKVAKARYDIAAQQQANADSSQEHRHEPEDEAATPVTQRQGKSYAELMDDIKALQQQNQSQREKDEESATSAKQKAAADRVEKRRKLINELTPKLDRFANGARIELSRAMGAPIPKRMDTMGWDRDLPVRSIIKPHMTPSMAEAIPASTDETEFRLFFHGTPEHFKALKRHLLFTLSVDLEGLSVEQAEAIANIVGGNLTFGTDMHLNGAAIKRTIDALSLPAASAPKPLQPAADPGADLAQWIKTNIAKKAGARLTSGEAHQRYSQDCAKRGIEPISLFSHRWKNTFLAEGIQSIRSDGTSFIDVQFKGDRK